MRARTGSSKHFGQPKETHLPAGKHTAASRVLSRSLQLQSGTQNVSGTVFALQDNIPSLLKDEENSMLLRSHVLA